MSRLRTPLAGFGAAVALLLGLAGPALANDRVPSGVTRVSVTLTFAPSMSGPARSPEQRTFTKAAKVSQIVEATDALAVAKLRGMCPMIMRVGPTLTVVFHDAKGASVAEELVQVVPGNRGDSGSSACFPIRFSSGGKGQSLLGNGFVRMIGRMLGTAIS